MLCLALFLSCFLLDLGKALYSMDFMPALPKASCIQ